jgi:hypothetical protein
LNIGKEQRIIQVEPEPLTVPVPEHPAEERRPAPVPEREPERVPAK